MADSERPSLGAIYKQQRAADKANQSTASKVIGGLFPILLVVGVALHGKAGTLFTVACAVIAVVCGIVCLALVRRERRSGAS
jgi:VIT1/CCC1 family predicted Fe2+/Mn2+ transporter